MDKLKYIKLENPDGTYSDSIPLAVDSDHVDVNGNTLTEELSGKANNYDISNLQNEINGLASGSPLVASSISEMTDVNHVYVNTSDGYWYYYDDSNWVRGGIYQSTSDSEDIQEIKNFLGNTVFTLTANLQHTSLRVNWNLTSPIPIGENIYIKMLEYIKTNASSVTVYGFKNSSDYDTLGSITDYDIHKFTIQNNYIQIRLVINYTNTDTSTISAKAIMGNMNNNSMITNIENLNEFKTQYDERVLNAKEKTTITESNIMNLIGTKNLNDFIQMNVYYFYQLTSLENAPLNVMTGLFYTICYNNRASGFIQYFLDENTNLLYYRTATGSASSPVYSNWERIAKASDIKPFDFKILFNNSTCKIFKKVVCCGDSYTAGYIVDGNGTVHETNEDYAWPHYMSTLTGNEWINCGKSGATAKSWLTADRGLIKAQSAGKAQAYIVGLMINDSSSRSVHLDVGTITDIGTDNESYYAYYSKVVRELNSINSEAKIFVLTCPKDDDTRYSAYNQAVRDIYNAYKDIYPIHLLDLREQINLFTNESLVNDMRSGHYTAMGYEQFSEILSYIISDYINNNIADFQDVAFIEYDE